jgi:hypothetical protein
LVFESIQNIKLWGRPLLGGLNLKIHPESSSSTQGGVKSVKSNDLWQTKDNRFYTWEEAKTKFNMVEGEKCIWEIIVEKIPIVWTRELISPTRQTKSG